MNIVENSRFLCHLPWKQVGDEESQQANTCVPASPRDIVLVKGTTGMQAPKDQFVALAYWEFVALAYWDEGYRPLADDYWFDMNNDHLTDQGWHVTHWCQL